MKAREHCLWLYDEFDDAWRTSCDHMWQFMDGGPKDNDMAFCCFCGKPLTEGAVLAREAG